MKESSKAKFVFLFQAIPEDMVLQMASYTDPKQVWDGLKTCFLGVDRVRTARLATLKRELESLRIKEGESVNDFASKLTGLASKARSLGYELEEQCFELDSMLFDETVRRLKAYEERIKGAEKMEDTQGGLLLASDGKSHGYKRCGNGGSNQNGFGRDRGRGRGFGKSRDVSNPVSNLLLASELVRVKGLKRLTDRGLRRWEIRMALVPKEGGSMSYQVLGTVEPRTLGEEPDEKKSKQALAFLFQAIPEDMVLQMASYTDPNQVWDGLKTCFLGVDRVRTARLARLKRELESLRMKEGESVDDFASKLTGLASKARSLGYELEEVDLVKRLLDSMPKSFLQIVASIEQCFELDSMLFDEAVRRLKAYEERIKGAEKMEDTQGGLLLASDGKSHGCKRCGNGGSNQDGFGRDRGRGRGSGKSRDVSNLVSNLHLASELVRVKGLFKKTIRMALVPKEGGSMSYQVPVLTSTNYPVWVVKVKSIMDAYGLWGTVEPRTLGEEPDEKKSKQALAFLFQAIPEDMVLQMRELESLRMKEGESVDDFASKLTDLASKARSLGYELEEVDLVKRLLDSMPKSFLQIVASIEQCFELDSMLFDEAVGRLKAYEERTKGAEKMEDTQGGLLLASDGNFKSTTFCGMNKYPEEHKCEFDLKKTGRDLISKANPVVKADKVNRI
ncbi:putative zinc finger, CCHC-type containing protein [Tanacetum coccineum]